MKRCFFALAIDDSTRAALASIQRDLQLVRAGARKLRIVQPDNLHVTLKFLGATPDELIDPISLAVARAVAPLPVEPASIEGLLAFPSANRPRVIGAAVGPGRESLVQIGNAVQNAVEPLGFEPEKRPYVPHVTLARVEGAKPRGPLSEWLDESGVGALGPVKTREIVLYESRLSPKGAKYTVLRTVPLE